MNAISPEQLEMYKQFNRVLPISDENSKKKVSENKEADIQKLLDSVNCWFDQWFTGTGFYSPRYGFSHRQERSRFALPGWTMADLLPQSDVDLLKSFATHQ